MIAPGDRYDLLPGLGDGPSVRDISALGRHRAHRRLHSAGVGEPADRRCASRSAHSGGQHGGTFETATTLASVRGRLTAGSPVKIATALRVFTESVDADALLAAIDVAGPEQTGVVTPLMFQYQLLDRARQVQKHIVLPEGEDPRILTAAASLLQLGVAELTLLGSPAAIRTGSGGRGRRHRAGAHRFARRRGSGRTVRSGVRATPRGEGHDDGEGARHRRDVSYFGTMMVHLGMADGMVSGARHTTAHTIKPSFEIIKTVPGTSIVSSVFLMCLADRVLIYGDCAVNPDPTPSNSPTSPSPRPPRRRVSGWNRRWPCFPTRRAVPGPVRTWTRSGGPPSWCTRSVPTCSSRARSNTTPPSTSPWPGRNCRIRRLPGTPPC